MNFFVITVAVIIITLSVSIIIHPKFLKEVLHELLKKKWLWPVSAARVILGALFIYIANSTNYPLFVGIFGTVVVLAGISVPLMGSHRIESMAVWWLNQKDYILRLGGFVGMLLGITLALSGI
ncbi:MAG TPA: hypothetical protein DCX54_06390 [Flavobacteriales bacterium]|nr:hypothetical protein [Flavobacteriales bacterium]